MKQEEKIYKGNKYGYLKAKISELAERDKCKKGETVPSIKINKWVREISKSGYQAQDGAVRSILTRLGYTKERKNKDG